MPINVYVMIAVLCSTLILSYLVNLVSHRYRVPSVLILLAIGMLMRPVLDLAGVAVPDLRVPLELLGVLGLIFIVLEAALGLKVDKANRAALLKGMAASAVLLCASVAGVAVVLAYAFGVDARLALLGAIPVSVMSSAVTIPAIAHLTKSKRAFLTYEATFSDVFGVLLFNAVLAADGPAANTVVSALGELLLIVVIAVACAFALALLLHRIRTEAKFILVLSVLILAYALGKLLHLSALLIILAFGMVLANRTRIFVGRLGARFFDGRLAADIRHFRVFVGEASFFIRTFFFVAFGLSIPVAGLADGQALLVALGVIAIVYAARAAYLRMAAGVQLFPELFIAPRGLITILLYYAIPQGMRLPAAYDNVLFLVVLVTNLLMMGMLFTKRESGRQVN